MLYAEYYVLQPLKWETSVEYCYLAQKTFAMKMSCLIMLSLIFLICGCDERNNANEQIDPKYAVNPTRDSNQPRGIYIPKDINDCFVELKRMLHPDFITEIKESSRRDLIDHHFGLGRWIRDNWELWRGSRLLDYFTEFGYEHPDIISGVIVIFFWQHLNGMPIDDIERQAELREYWRQIKEEPKNPACPDHSVPIKIMYQLTGTVMKENKLFPRCIHVGYCIETSEIWTYEFEKGWRRPDDVIRKRIDELQGVKNLKSAPIEKP
jgi:hypothetical protein